MSSRTKLLMWIERAFKALLLTTLITGHPARGDNLRSHWAYQPLAQIQIPRTKNTNWIRSSVDSFILAKLESKALQPAAEADKRALLRRVYFDLIGLPPTPEEMRTYLSDPSPQAYESAVDRLLASPHHGERWARHWIDVVHFAETHGHDQDRIRTNAWPYRDYLIASFNNDKPYAPFCSGTGCGRRLVSR